MCTHLMHTLELTHPVVSMGTDHVHAFNAYIGIDTPCGVPKVQKELSVRGCGCAWQLTFCPGFDYQERQRILNAFVNCQDGKHDKVVAKCY